MRLIIIKTILISGGTEKVVDYKAVTKYENKNDMKEVAITIRENQHQEVVSSDCLVRNAY